MQSGLAKSTALLLVKAVLSFFFSLSALELLQGDKVLHGSLTHTVVISQSRLAPCPTKHNSLEASSFSMATLQPSTQQTIAPAPSTSPLLVQGRIASHPAHGPALIIGQERRQWRRSCYPLPGALGDIKEKKRHWRHSTFPVYFCLGEKMVAACGRCGTPKSASVLRPTGVQIAWHSKSNAEQSPLAQENHMSLQGV